MTSLKELSEQLAQINKLYSTPVPVYLNFSHEEPLGTIKGNQHKIGMHPPKWTTYDMNIS